MSNLVTFSSDAFENDEQTATTRFTSFNLDGADAQTLQAINNRISSGRPAGLSFEGMSLLDVADELEAVECRGLTGPRSNIANEREAIAQEGELVTVSYVLNDGVTLTEKGIITELAIRVGPQGKLAQRVDMVFHKIDLLRYHYSNLILRAAAVS